MKKTALVSVLGAIGLAQAGAASAQEVGRVISSTPVVQQIPVSRQVCAQQPMAVQPQSSGGGALIGAIVGGVLGNQIGHGFGRAAATGVGAIAGAAVGDNLERRTDPYAHQAAHCTTQTTYENRTVAYNVQYEYGGKTFNVQMPYDPGPTVQLQIQPVTSQAPQALAPHDGVQAAHATQPIIVQQTPSVVYPAYAHPAPVYPIYYARPYWAAPPVSFSFGYIHHGGHRHHRHWHR